MVGKRVQNITTAICVIAEISYLIFAILLGKATPVLGWGVFLGGTLVNALVFSSLYAFGQLVDDVHEIKEKQGEANIESSADNELPEL